MNMLTTAHVGAKTFKANLNRRYLLIVCTLGSIEISIGGGTGKLPLAVGGVFEPWEAPTGSIEITGTGAYTILTQGLTEA